MRSQPRPVVALDVSAAAAGLWPVLHSTLEGVADVLPESAWPDVAFLGGAALIPLREFLRDADTLHAMNAGRGRVVGPLLEAFGDWWPGRVVVIAARPVVDLADWIATPFARRIVVVRIDPTVSIAGGAFAESDLTDVASVARLVELPAAELRTTIRGGFQFAGDFPDLGLHGGRVTTDTDVTLGVLSPHGQPEVTAELVRRGVEPDRLSVSPCEPPEAAPWQTFTSAELTMLDAWRGGRPAYCAACRNDHPPGAVDCSVAGATGFPSLSRVPRRQFLRVRVKMFQATFQAAGASLRVNETDVVNLGPLPQVWRYTGGDWARSAEPWGWFERLTTDDEFALFLP